MFGEKRTKEVLVLAIAALFVVAVAYTAFAITISGNSAPAEPFRYTGKVVAIDNANKILTVQDEHNNQQIFELNTNGELVKCDKPVAWSDIKSGDTVTVAYFERGNGSYVADTVWLAPAMKERC